MTMFQVDLINFYITYDRGEGAEVQAHP